MLELGLIPAVCLAFVATAVVSHAKFAWVRYFHIVATVCLGLLISFFVALFMFDAFEYEIVMSNSRSDLFWWYKLPMFFTTLPGLFMGAVLTSNVGWIIAEMRLLPPKMKHEKMASMVCLTSVILLIVVTYVNPFEAASGLWLDKYPDGVGRELGLLGVLLVLRALLFVIASGAALLLFCLGFTSLIQADEAADHHPLIRPISSLCTGAFALTLGASFLWGVMAHGLEGGIDVSQPLLGALMFASLAASRGQAPGKKAVDGIAWKVLAMAPLLVLLLSTYVLWSGKWESLYIQDSLATKWFGSPLDSAFLLLTVSFILIFLAGAMVITRALSAHFKDEGKLKHSVPAMSGYLAISCALALFASALVWDNASLSGAVLGLLAIPVAACAVVSAASMMSKGQFKHESPLLYACLGLPALGLFASKVLSALSASDTLATFLLVLIVGALAAPVILAREAFYDLMRKRQ